MNERIMFHISSVVCMRKHLDKQNENELIEYSLAKIDLNAIYAETNTI